MPVFTEKRLLSEKAEAASFFVLINFIVGVTFCTLCFVKQETVTFVADGSPVKRKQFARDKISSSMVSDDCWTTQFASVGFHERDLGTITQ